MIFGHRCTIITFTFSYICLFEVRICVGKINLNAHLPQKHNFGDKIAILLLSLSFIFRSSKLSIELKLSRLFQKILSKKSFFWERENEWIINLLSFWKSHTWCIISNFFNLFWIQINFTLLMLHILQEHIKKWSEWQTLTIVWGLELTDDFL